MKTIAPAAPVVEAPAAPVVAVAPPAPVLALPALPGLSGRSARDPPHALSATARRSAAFIIEEVTLRKSNGDRSNDGHGDK
jgi:hypothetical protein